MFKMKFRSALYSSLLLATLFLGACREKKLKYDYPNDFCPVATVTLPETDSAFIVVPNAFTPNGDGLNDTWKPVVNHISSLEMKVIDAAGNILFHSNRLDEGWQPMHGSKTGIIRYKAWVKATSNAGNVTEQCSYIYVYYCLPENAPVDINTLLFADQVEPSQPGTYFATQEMLDFCK